MVDHVLLHHRNELLALMLSKASSHRFDACDWLPSTTPKAFPVRSVPESLQQAAEKSLESMRKEGASESDVMKAICDWGKVVGLF